MALFWIINASLACRSAISWTAMCCSVCLMRSLSWSQARARASQFQHWAQRRTVPEAPGGRRLGGGCASRPEGW
jgi:hypothetical protein